jgi:hypothetical protein
MSENERPFCFCQTGGISTHYHNPEKYGCPMQPVPTRRSGTGPVSTLEFNAAMCEHGNPGYCDRCQWIKEREEDDFFEEDEDVVTLEEALDLALKLNPEDPFERVLVDMVAMNRRKRRDYALDGSPFSNFDTSSAALGLDGFGPVESAVFNVAQKMARLRSLRANGRMNDTSNETVDDTYLDLAIYACIALAISRYPEGKVA